MTVRKDFDEGRLPAQNRLHKASRDGIKRRRAFFLGQTMEPRITFMSALLLRALTSHAALTVTYIAQGGMV